MYFYLRKPTLFFLMAFCLGIASDSRKNKYLEWKPIRGSHGYQLQIRNPRKKIIVNQKIKSNRYPAYRLSKGHYQCRVAPLNVFQKPVIWSHWRPLVIMEKPQPILYSGEAVRPLSPVNTKVDVSTGEPLQFSWAKAKDAQYYQFRILHKKKKKEKVILKKKTKNNQYQIENLSRLQRGKFVWEVTPYDKKNRPGKKVRSPFTIDARKVKKKLKPGDLKIISPEVLYLNEKK